MKRGLYIVFVWCLCLVPSPTLFAQQIDSGYTKSSRSWWVLGIGFSAETSSLRQSYRIGMVTGFNSKHLITAEMILERRYSYSFLDYPYSITPQLLPGSSVNGGLLTYAYAPGKQQYKRMSLSLAVGLRYTKIRWDGVFTGQVNTAYYGIDPFSVKAQLISLRGGLLWKCNISPWLAFIAQIGYGNATAKTTLTTDYYGTTVFKRNLWEETIQVSLHLYIKK